MDSITGNGSRAARRVAQETTGTAAAAAAGAPAAARPSGRLGSSSDGAGAAEPALLAGAPRRPDAPASSVVLDDPVARRPGKRARLHAPVQDSGLDRLAPDLLRTVASFAPTARLGLLAQSSRALSAAAEPALHIASIERHLPLVDNAVAYTELLHGRPGAAHARSVSDLPPGPVQDRFLRTINERIHGFDAIGQVQAVASLASLAYAGPHEATHDVVRAAQRGRPALNEREAGLVLAGGAAHDAVLRGARVCDVIDQHAISSPFAIEALEQWAIRRAMRALRTDQDIRIPDLVADLGLDRPGAILSLQTAVTRRIGLLQIRQGIEPDEVVDRLRVTEPSVVQSLRLLAAQRNVERGYDVVSQRAGLNLPAGDPQELELERRSARTAAFRQVLQGHDAGGAALALGISDQIRQEVLEPLVAWLDEQVAVGALTMPQRQQFARCILGGDASDAVLRGECVQAVASRCGITTSIAIDALQAAAASFIGLSFATGDRLCDRMAAAGVTTPERTRVLERTIAITHGQAAVTAGDQPLDVARRLQLTRPESLRSLAEAAAMRDIARGDPVPVAAERHGIDTDDAALMRELELQAVHTHGRRLLLGGMAIELVRERLGLRQREADDDLRVLQQLQA